MRNSVLSCLASSTCTASCQPKIWSYFGLIESVSATLGIACHSATDRSHQRYTLPESFVTAVAKAMSMSTPEDPHMLTSICRKAIVSHTIIQTHKIHIMRIPHSRELENGFFVFLRHSVGGESPHPRPLVACGVTRGMGGIVTFLITLISAQRSSDE
jgi:hypothetical protein